MLDTNRVRWKKYKRLITNGSTEIIHCRGTQLTVLTAPSANLLIAFDDQEASEIPQGITLDMSELPPFQKVALTNNSGSDSTVEISVAEGRIYDNRFNVAGAILTKSGTGLTSPVAVSTAGAAATVFAAASSSVNEIIVQNHSTTETCWIGDATVGNDAGPVGYRIDPKSAIILTTGAALWIRRGGAVDVTATSLVIS